jgi:hypothetical protein
MKHLQLASTTLFLLLFTALLALGGAHLMYEVRKHLRQESSYQRCLEEGATQEPNEFRVSFICFNAVYK